MFDIRGIENLMVEEMRKVMMKDKLLNMEMGPAWKKINFFKTGAYLASPHPVAFYVAGGVKRDLAREVEIVLNQAGWLFAHAYVKSGSYNEWKEYFDSYSPWFYITRHDGSVYTLCYIPERLLDKVDNGTLTIDEANEMIDEIVDYFDRNPDDFKLAYKDVVLLTNEVDLINITLNVYNIRSYKDYDKAEIDLYNELYHDETVERLYFERVLPYIKERLKIEVVSETSV